MSDKSYEIENADQFIVFRITRPQRLNAITSDVLDGLTTCIDTLESQSGNRGLIVTGAGERAFCAGTDLFERASLTDEQRVAKSDRARDLLIRLHHAPFVSIAALNGLAYGGGLELAMACLFRLAAPHATCSLPEVKIGLIPAYAGTQLLPILIGRSQALDMMLTGRSVAAKEALQMGLINRIATDDKPLLEQAIDYLASITQYSKVAITAIRDCVAVTESQVTDQGLQLERDKVLEVGKSEDAEEGVAAFREKRKPQFKHC
jgi:enoyl-CoA hydratase